MLNAACLRVGCCLQQCTSLHIRCTAVRCFGSAVDLAFDKFGGKTTGERNVVPMVILHGLFGQKRNWRSLAKQFQRQLRNTVFTLDLRNHGTSPWTSTMSYPEMAGDVVHFLGNIMPTELGGQRRPVHLLGHSMGGKTAMHLALMPGTEQYIASLIVEDVAPRRYPPRDAQRDFTHIIDTMKQINLSRSRHEIGEELRQAIPNDIVTRKFLLSNLAPTSEDAAGGAKWRWKLNLDTIGKQLEQICAAGIGSDGYLHRPALFVSGGKSNHVTVADRANILRTFPLARFEVIRDAAHWVHSEEPQQFLLTVLKFIKSLPS